MRPICLSMKVFAELSVSTPIAVLCALLIGFMAPSARAQTSESLTEQAEIIRPAADTDRAAFSWVNRILVVFADSDSAPRFRQQIEKLNADLDALRARDVVVLVDTDPAALAPLRSDLRPRGFMWVLIGKDGNVYLRKPFPWSIREITRSIDKMPLRQQEIRDRR